MPEKRKNEARFRRECPLSAQLYAATCGSVSHRAFPRREPSKDRASGRIGEGGSYRFQMRSPEGDIHWWHGVVREIVEPERIVWTCSINNTDGTSISAETLLTVSLEEYAGKTRLTLHQAIFESIAVRDAHSNGWSDAFGRLAEHLASA